MDNVVTINNQKTNTLELDVSVQGLDTADIRVWLSVAAEGMELCFECNREGHGEKWVVIVPPLPFITRTAYPCAVKIVADGYYFEPLIGTMNVIGSAEVYSSTPANVTLNPKSDDKKDDEEVTVTESKPSKGPAHQPKTKSREKGIDQIAKELMERNSKDDKSPEAEKDDKTIAKKVKPLTERQKKRAESKKIADDLLREKKIKEDAANKAKKSKQIDETVEAIKTREQARKDKEAKKPVTAPEPIVEDVQKDDPKVEEPKLDVVESVIEVAETKIDVPVVDVVEKIDEKINVKKVDVKKVLAEAKAKAKKVTKKKRIPHKKPEIPKKEIQDFKLRPKKVDPKKAAEKIDETKNDAIKAILEDLGVQVSDKPQNFVVKTSAKRSSPDVVDLEAVARELMEKSKSDPKNVEKKEAANKAAQLQEVVESEKDSEVMAILEEIGIKPEGAKNVPRVSFIKKDTH